MQEEYDIVVIGGGLVGASFACALQRQGLRIAVVEQFDLLKTGHACYDDRSVALAYGTRGLFELIGVWERIAPDAAPIEKIHVSEQGGFGVTRLDHAQQGVEALGYVIENRLLGAALYRHLDDRRQMDFFMPDELSGFRCGNDRVSVHFVHQGRECVASARLLVAADGAQSRVRDWASLRTTIKDYGQSAIVCNLTPEYPHESVAYERFTGSGPLAFLPLNDFAEAGRSPAPHCAVVWNMSHAQAQQMSVLDEDAFLRALQERFGYRLGRLLHRGKVNVYPLRLVKAETTVSPRVALIGNAAHTLHPVAGQGFNLGMRDAMALAELISTAAVRGGDIGGEALLRTYAQSRRRDHQRVIRVTDMLAQLFTFQWPPLRLARNLGMLVTDTVPWCKTLLARSAMGLDGRLPGFRQ